MNLEEILQQYKDRIKNGFIKPSNPTTTPTIIEPNPTYYFYNHNKKEVVQLLQYQVNLNIYGKDCGLNYYYEPLTDEQVAFYQANPDASAHEVRACKLDEPYTQTLDDAKQTKINEIEMYDMSESVNGFYYDGIFMWLDKATRVGLVNMLNSAEILGQETVQIWYEQYNLTLTIQEARVFLAALEMYAAQCYNVTELHKREVNELETIESVEQYDITTGYPEQIHFESQNN